MSDGKTANPDRTVAKKTGASTFTCFTCATFRNKPRLLMANTVPGALQSSKSPSILLNCTESAGSVVCFV
jgi:hypothetical protein